MVYNRSYSQDATIINSWKTVKNSYFTVGFLELSSGTLGLSLPVRTAERKQEKENERRKMRVPTNNGSQ
jgi:hypothetical protein